MFGKRKTDDYDEYNEKYSSKYDDDYIAPSKEYRSECDHDHEQTYSDIDDVRDCDHSHGQTYSNLDDVRKYYHDTGQTYEDLDDIRDCSHDHGQTYEDHNKEQKPYDDHADIEHRFKRLLVADEHLLWVGGKSPGKESERHKKTAKIVMIISFFVMFVSCFIFLIPFSVIAAIVMISAFWKYLAYYSASYALTDQRLIITSSERLTSLPLWQIMSVQSVSGSTASRGSLMLTLAQPFNPFPQTSARSSSVLYINNITDHMRVKRILQDAIRDAKNK